ncbi:Glycerophosphoryl diester phosphodiesterase family protein [compost metagenome]
MPFERAQADPALVQDLNAAGAKTFVHTVNSPEEVDEMRQLGVHGVYTDFLSNKSKYFTKVHTPYVEAGSGGLAAANEPAEELSGTTSFTGVLWAGYAGLMVAVVVAWQGRRSGRRL